MKKVKYFKCYFDGACEPKNPGGALGIGYCINEFNGSDYVAPDVDNSNNVAEYLAFRKVIDSLQDKRGCKIEIFGDSMLVIMQMTGKWKIKNGMYKDIALRTLPLFKQLQQLNDVTLKWIPRELNSRADKQSVLSIENTVKTYTVFETKKKLMTTNN
jgi:ribonuclease HI